MQETPLFSAFSRASRQTGLFGGYHAKAVVAVDDRRGVGLADDADVGMGLAAAGLQPVHIGHDPEKAMGSAAGQVGVQQGVGNDGGVLGRDVLPHEDLRYQSADLFGICL